MYSLVIVFVFIIDAEPVVAGDDEISFVDQPPFDVKCPVCFEIFEDAHQTSCCGNHVCSQCSSQLKKKSNCPFCREPNFTATSDKFFARQVLSLQVECYNSKRGCPWTGDLRALKQHIEETCTKSFAKCKHCSLKCPHNAFSEHVHVCVETPLPCPNKCPAKTAKRKDFKRHLEQECPLRVVTGGIFANQRIQVAPLAVTMTNYSQYVRTGNMWYSPPFYTHKNGYKVCLRVDANWYRKGNISVLVCVLKGEYDKVLSWPLHAMVEVALYNWKTNEPLYSKVLYLPGDFFCSANTTDVPHSWGKGSVDFIKHGSLASELSLYVQHDCLSFQIKRVTIVKAPAIPNLPRWAGDKCFVAPSFRSMKQKDLIFYGPQIAMPTNKGSYKICPRIDPNGYSAGKGSHVSVSCALMKGEDDDALSWPIEADIIVEMVNWRENKNHKSHTISLNQGANIKSVSRVPITGVAEIAWGGPTFATHSSLSHNPTTNTQYLNQDCLLFRVQSYALYSDKVSATRLPAWVNPAVGSPYPCFTVSEFTKRKAFKNYYYSNPFFSHRDGYKMQVRVDAAKGQNVSLYLYLMKGPNDDQLLWPFRGDVVIELVNWQRDKDHHRKLISLSSKCTNTVCDRVMSGDRGIHYWGYDSFVSHNSLPFNAETGTEYLQNDCLHFRVKEVAVFSTATLYKVPMWQNYHSLPPYFQFTVNNFTRRKSLNNSYYSPALYTHRGGYKIRFEVDPREQGQCITLYARVLKGENDATLGWPLCVDIVVELLNWREDRNHHSHTISLHERLSIKYSGRVEVGDSAENAWGTGSFISYSSLPYNHSTNTEYLNSDCLCFRVKKIVAYSATLTAKVPRWQPRNEPASFTITDVAERRDSGNTYYSPPFYAAKYKMCLSVDVGGNGAQKGKHVSVYACLLKGEHDDTLEWPFLGDITVQVLNWQRDRGHFQNVLSLDEGSQNNGRVMTEATEPAGYGEPKYMPISTLFSHYLEDQCMRMRVSKVLCYNTPLRFKTPSWQGRWNPSLSNSLIEFTITHFSGRLASGSTYYSPPFYTHNKGYKMRLEIKAQGTEEDKGNMSLYARLMAGENDDSLKWPMNVDLTVEMVNWTRNSVHVLKIIKFGNASMKARSQVPKRDETASGSWGFGKFCSHATMFDRRRNVEYVQEDCVCIRVKGALIHSQKRLLGIF